MDGGLLVPDDVTVSMVLDPSGTAGCRAGVLLDGFPQDNRAGRALAKALARQEKVGAVLYIKVPNEVLMVRFGPADLPDCGAMYHKVFYAAEGAGHVRRCGGELYARADDTVGDGAQAAGCLLRADSRR